MYAVWQMGTSVAEQHDASILLKTKAVVSSEMLDLLHQSIQHHISEDHNVLHLFSSHYM
jgi:hypothetical protein